MKNYVQAFQEKIAEINAAALKFSIINAGIMNHGKSSLFNSLLDKNIFKATDKRETVEIQTEQWRDNVYLIDTPGLEAETADDAVAYEAYRRADVILFVHRVDTGELHRKGLESLNKIKLLFPNEKIFIEHFCLVLTAIEEQSVEDKLDTIRDKVLGDIKKFCGLSGFKVFCVSNTLYEQGKKENEEFFISESGIPKLREYLQQNFLRWFSENKTIRVARIAREKEFFISQLNQERNKIQSRIQFKTEQIQQQQINFLYKVETAINLWREDESKYNSESRRLEELRRELQNLQNRWSNEHY